MKKIDPQEFANLIGMYIGMDKNRRWFFHKNEPALDADHEECRDNWNQRG